MSSHSSDPAFPLIGSRKRSCRLDREHGPGPTTASPTAERSPQSLSSFERAESTALAARSRSLPASASARSASRRASSALASSSRSRSSRARLFSSLRLFEDFLPEPPLRRCGTTMPSNGENPLASSSSTRTPRASAFRDSSPASAALSRSFTRRRIASLAFFPRESIATATSASSPSARSRSAVALSN
jgi:hypothetical protein